MVYPFVARASILGDTTVGSLESSVISVPLDNSTKPTTKREENQRRFLEAFRRELGHIGKAARRAGIHRDTHYGWLQDDNEEGYRKAFASVKQDLVEDLEAEADRRALKGTLKPVFYQGEACGQIREFSDVLLIFRLKALKPEMYRDNVKIDQAVKHSGAMNLKKEPFDFDEFRRLCELERAERTLPAGHVSIHQVDSAHADGEAGHGGRSAASRG